MMGIDPQRPGQMLTYGVFCHIESWIPGPDGTVSAVIAAGEMVELIGLGEDDEKEHSNDDSPNLSKDDSANQLESNLKSGTSSGVGSSSGRRSDSSAPTELVEARGAPPFVLKSGVSSTFCLKKWRLLHLLS